MSTNVQLFTFSILGVPGFKAASAVGFSENSRMRSALGEIQQELKAMTEPPKPGYCYPGDIDKIKQAMVLAKDISVFFKEYGITEAMKDVVKTEELTTDQYLAKSSTLFEGNTDLFLEHYDAIQDNYKKIHVDSQIEEGFGNPPPQARLYICTGGIFKNNKPFAYFVPEHMVQNLDKIGEQGKYPDIRTYIVYALQTALLRHKGSLITMVAREKDAVKGDAMAENLKTMDRLYDLCNEIDITDMGTVLVTENPTAKLNKILINQMEEAVRLLEMGVASRFHAHWSSFINKVAYAN